MSLRTFSIGLLAVFMALVISGASVAGMSAEKATGYVHYTAVGLERSIDFNAHEATADRPAKGWLHYEDVTGQWYDVDVRYVNVDPQSGIAYFAGPVVYASNPSWTNYWGAFAVCDKGTPGRKGDKVAGVFTNETAAFDYVNSGTVPGAWYSVFGGNLVVHPSKK